MELKHNDWGPSYIIMHIYHSIILIFSGYLLHWLNMNLNKAQHDAMEIMDSDNNKAKQKTDFVWAPYVKKMFFWKINTASFILKISLPTLQGTPWIGQIWRPPKGKSMKKTIKNCWFYTQNGGSGLFWTGRYIPWYVAMVLRQWQGCTNIIHGPQNGNYHDLRH